MARKSARDGLAPLELSIMQVIWTRGESSVTEVQSQLESTLAYTTVQTMLNSLEKKGKLTRRLLGRAFIYSARVSEAAAIGQGVRDLIDRMFGGSAEDLVISLLRNREIDSKKLAELTKRFKEGADPL
jgi:BlaI family transcriptional regulator, penicillinase repressor